MEKIIVKPELCMNKIICEIREVADAFNELADELEQIEKKYAKDFNPRELLRYVQDENTEGEGEE